MDIQTATEQVAQDNEGVVVPLRDRNGDPDVDSQGVQASITVLGEYAEKVKKTNESQSRRMWKLKPGQFDPVELTKKNRIDTAAAAIIAWSGILDAPEDKGGKPLPCTPENAARVLTAAPWILKQVEAAIESPASFFGTRSSS